MKERLFTSAQWIKNNKNLVRYVDEYHHLHFGLEMRYYTEMHFYATLCWKFVTDFEISNEQEEQSITLLYIHVCRLYVSMDVILQYPISFELVH